MNTSTNGDHPTLDDARSLLERDGRHPVFLHIAARMKGPEWSGWSRISYAETLTPEYQARLRSQPNTGILLGAPSDNLCAIDLDTEAALEGFLELNPAFVTTFRTHGARGAQLWAYVQGERPHQVHPHKVDKDSPLAVGCEKPPDSDGKNPIGEFRAEGGQSVIRGVHPSGCRYTWLVAREPITIAFDQIRWPADIARPWEPSPVAPKTPPKAAPPNHSPPTSDPSDLLERAKEKLTIDFLWQHFGYGERRHNPVASPFRSDNTKGHPSFSIYQGDDNLQRFRDHNASYDRHRGDAYDFYQLATGTDSHKAFVGFVTLAGLGDELGKNKPKGEQSAAAGGSTAPDPQTQQPAVDYTDDELNELTKRYLDYYQFDDQEFPKLMDAQAFYGIAGEVVNIIKVESEAAPEAILGQFLIGFGNIVGRGPYKKQASTHHLNEFGVLVGETSFGRKGTAWDATEELFGVLDHAWLSDRVRDGFQSGEAIVHAVRDSRTVYTGKRASHDPGVADKRLQMMEDEFGRFLMIASRVGNALSSMTRKSCDAKQWLYTEGKIAPEKATGAHISLIGHITKSELLKCIQEVENQNGFSNRILWIAAYRREIIPRPQPIFWQKDHPDIVRRMEKILGTFGNGKKRELDWSKLGKSEWDDFYRSLKGSGSSIVGSIIARSAAHVLRLTMIYTVLDHSALMEPKHLQAATAFWQYCVRSAQWMFRENTGNKIADRIYWALRRARKGMTREQITADIFSRNCPRIILEQAFNDLIKANLATVVVERTAQARKPTQRWFSKKPE